MSRCYACDCELSDWEATRKSKVTGEYLDLCDTCFSEVADVFISVEERSEQEELDLISDHE
jgi:hypothetical protein